MSKKDEELFERLLVSGIIGAALGALLSKNKGAGAVIGALGGAAILASWEATEEAKKTSIPLIYEENGILYEIHPDGTKKTVKKLPKSNRTLPKRFDLK